MSSSSHQGNCAKITAIVAWGIALRLLTLLILRLMAVVLLCLTLAIGWITVDSHHAIEVETAASADRVNRHFQSIYWQVLLWRGGSRKETLLPKPHWETLTTQSILSPGVCVTFAAPGADQRTLCSQVEALGPLPPAWFANAYTSLLGPHEPISRLLSIRDPEAGAVVIMADPGAALRQSWRQVSTVVGIATVMAAGIALLAALMIGHALLPARSIIKALQTIEKGGLTLRLPKFRSVEFNHIGRAVNALAARLQQNNAERTALTARLFQVQEEERRALARDLHDEFGQSLAATTALAALIEASAAPDREDIAADARAIARTQGQMMENLRSTLVRLRSQNIEEVGLEASLRQLIADHNTQSASRTVFKLDVVGRIAALHKRMAVDLYRIAQECLTNATRHGSPTEVRVVVEHVDNEREHVALTVVDDGGGDVAKFRRGLGHGILGIRERLAALGGLLSIDNAAHGIRVSVMIPLGSSNQSGSVGETFA
jgi:two-component system, NarL family, sensor histidine kinase UhpB